MSWYKTGTIAATNGSKIITGTGTQFTNSLNGVSAGRMLLLPAAGTVQIYEIESVQSDTQLTLVSAFTGATGTGKAYAIPTSPAVSIEQFAHEFASTLAYYQQQLSGWQQIQTGTGNVTLTTPDGQSVTVRSQAAWDTALNGKVTGAKQSSSTDATPNAIMALGANGTGSFGLGGNTVYLTETIDLHVYLKTAKTGFYSANTAIINGLSFSSHNYFWQKYNDNYGTLIAMPIGSNQNQISVKTMVNGVWSGWKTMWDSGTLAKQSQNLANSNEVLVAGLAGGIGRNVSQLLPNATLASNFRINGVWYATSNQQSDIPSNGHFMNIFGHPDGAFGAQAWIDYRNNSPSFRYRTIENSAVAAWHEMATLDTAQTFTGAKAFTNTVAMGNAVFRAASANTGIEVGRIDAASTSFIDFHTSGNDIDYDVRLITSGGTGVIGQGTLNINALSLQWNGNGIATLPNAQTFTGVKTFSAKPIVARNYCGVAFDSNLIASGVLGRVLEIEYEGAPSLAFLRRTAQDVTAGQQRVIVPFPAGSTAGNYSALVQNVNAVADSNGFWKTASPVIKLFTDGTSELTSEAEGITTERLSEGVYRISGCLGLNADRAWGGDDGGIDVPMCRNKLPRLWVDYGGDDGSETINPDGSIVIRTYHRPHPDAPAFARNQIDGYANGDPIDIPHDTFISVRVQMPETEAPEEEVETMPNEGVNEAVLETSADA